MEGDPAVVGAGGEEGGTLMGRAGIGGRDKESEIIEASVFWAAAMCFRGSCGMDDDNVDEDDAGGGGGADDDEEKEVLGSVAAEEEKGDEEEGERRGRVERDRS